MLAAVLVAVAVSWFATGQTLHRKKRWLITTGVGSALIIAPLLVAPALSGGDLANQVALLMPAFLIAFPIIAIIRSRSVTPEMQAMKKFMR